MKCKPPVVFAFGWTLGIGLFTAGCGGNSSSGTDAAGDANRAMSPDGPQATAGATTIVGTGGSGGVAPVDAVLGTGGALGAGGVLGTGGALGAGGMLGTGGGPSLDGGADVDGTLADTPVDLPLGTGDSADANCDLGTMIATGGADGGGIAGAGGRGGSGGTIASGGSVGEGPRKWERQQVQANAGLTGVAIADDGTVDIAYVGSVGSQRGIVWQRIGAAPELVSVAAQVASRPAVGRDASGSVHVVWGTTSPNEIRYAVRSAASRWTVETIATGRFRPDLALSADGTPHVAFVDEEVGNAMAYHAVRGASGWQVTTVHATEWMIKSQAGIALDANGVPIIAAPGIGRTGIWVAQANGTGGWIIEDLASDRKSISGPLALAIATAGAAVAFKDQAATLVAWRPAGAAAWTIETASPHAAFDVPLDVVVTPSGPMVVSDVDIQYPNGLALLERTDAGWMGQLLGKRAPDGCGEVGLAAAVDLPGQPAVALVCHSALYYMTVTGHYPADWPQRCAAAATEMCSRACTCGSSGQDCCWGLRGNSTCTSVFGCPRNAQATLCGDPTISPTSLEQCRDQLQSLTCATNSRLELGGICGPLYNPFESP